MQSREKKRTGRKPGPNAGKGRPKGVPNKITHDVRQMVLHALDQAGGVGYLTAQASANPSAFMSLVAKCMPAQVEAKIEQNTTITVQERRQKALELIEAAFGNATAGRVDARNDGPDAHRVH